MTRRSPGFAGQLAIVTVASAAFRLWYVFTFRRHKLPYLGDAYYYTAGANAIARGYGFINPYGIWALKRVPSASHPPLYELWLAIPSIPHDATQFTHMLWTVLLGTATVVVVGLAGREMAGPRVGIIAAVLAAAYPNIWVHD